MCIKNEENVKVDKSVFEVVQDNAVQENAVQENQMVDGMEQQMQYGEQEQLDLAEKLKQDFMTETEKMKDSVSLGRKTPVLGFKADAEAKRQKNAKIDRLRMFTKKATADTEDVYKLVVSHKPKRRDETDEQKEIFVENALITLGNVEFKPEMYYSSNIKANLERYILLVQDFDYVNKTVSEAPDGSKLKEYKGRLDNIAGVYTCLKKRLQVYCNQNRVHLDGRIMDDNEKAEKLTKEDRENWYATVEKYNREIYWADQEEGQEQEEKQEQAKTEAKETSTESEQTKTEATEEDLGENDKSTLEVEKERQEQRQRAKELKKEVAEKIEERKNSGEDITDLMVEKEEIDSDAQRMEVRDRKEEIGMASVQAETTVTTKTPIMKMTREKALDNESDRLSRKSRLELEHLCELLEKARNAPGVADVVNVDTIDKIIKAVKKYVKGDRYSVGYTTESKLLMEAKEAVKKEYDLAKIGVEELDELENLIKEYQKSGDTNWEKATELGKRINGRWKERKDFLRVYMILCHINSYFETMTNGTLGAHEVKGEYNYVDKFMNERGDVPGRNRSGLIRFFSEWSYQKDAPLFAHEPTINDLKQRLVSNCYMLASVTGLINLDPSVIKECIWDNGDGTVTVRIHKVTEKGENAETEATDYSSDDIDKLIEQSEKDAEDMNKSKNTEGVKKEFETIYVKVRKSIPRLFSGSMDALSAGALWMQMIEQAFASVGKIDERKLVGGKRSEKVEGFTSLWYGNGGEFLERLLGVPSEKVVMGDKNKDTVFQELCNARANNCVYNAGTKKGAGAGLTSGHAYAVLGAFEENGIKYVWLRNPYSTNSLQYGKEGSRSMTGHSLSYSSDETYGQFYIKYDDFYNEFTNLTRTDINEYYKKRDAANRPEYDDDDEMEAPMELLPKNMVEYLAEYLGLGYDGETGESDEESAQQSQVQLDEKLARELEKQWQEEDDENLAREWQKKEYGGIR
ncbi:MAG: C2 family cysteine protease [Lachnospiraceae bacterium]